MYLSIIEETNTSWEKLEVILNERTYTHCWGRRTILQDEEHQMNFLSKKIHQKMNLPLKFLTWDIKEKAISSGANDEPSHAISKLYRFII